MTAAPALHVRVGGGWKTIDQATADVRVREYAHGLLELGCADGVVALDGGRDGEAVLIAGAAWEAGIPIALGPAVPPFAAAFARDPVRAAELALTAGIPADRVVVPTLQDQGVSLERLAAHGALHAALRADRLDERRAGLTPDAPALIGASGIVLSRGEVGAGLAALRNVGDLLRPNETTLIGGPLDQPWLIGLAFGALATGGSVAIGRVRDAAALQPGVIVASAAAVEEVAQQVELGASRRARAQSLRRQRGDGTRSTLLPDLARRLGLQHRAPAPRCIIVVDGMIPRDLCTDLHAIGTTVLHGAAAPWAAAPFLLNRPHRYRFDAVGLPLPDHDLAVDDGTVEVRGPAVHGGVCRATIALRSGPDGFLLAAGR